jgi:pimeloyl-ACP methyl ester carboxylesterase
LPYLTVGKQTSDNIALCYEDLATAPEFAIEQLNAWTGGHPYGNAPSRVEAPVLPLTSDDRFFTRSFLVKEVASRFDFVCVWRIEGAGHWPQLEKPFEKVREITRFVDAVTETTSPEL